VASGDPLSDRVILWTRVTPNTQNDTTLMVTWAVATDTGMTNVVQSGTVTTDASRDYTVKVDADGLSSNSTYYYEFDALGNKSLRGRTRTAPTAAEADQLRFVVVSCSNYEAGYFSAYAGIAERNDLDAVLHLGDYIYEYPANVYGDTTLVERRHDSTEASNLDSYRARYSLYRLDHDLRSAHQQHPFINIWDDHETANDAWSGGAENHTDSTEGDWQTRRMMARQAYFEWIPIRDTPDGNIYRNLDYGDLVDVIMLDTRLAGRDSQILDVTNPALYAPTRTLLGDTQRQWFFDQLGTSTAKWKVVGNQVIFAQFNVGWAAVPPQTPADVENIFLDIWDGYPAERLQIINYIRDQSINNVVFVTGDFHCSFGFDVADTVTNDAALYAPVDNYDPATGAGSVAIEFATPSISAANFDENVGAAQAAGLEFQINNPFPAPAPPNVPNPHMKHVDLDRHGYVLLDLTSDRAQANWYYVDQLDLPNSPENFGAAYYSRDGENHLTAANAASPDKPNQEVPAPGQPRDLGTGVVAPAAALAVMGIYPNPAEASFVVQYALSQPGQVRMQLLNAQGQTVTPLLDANQRPGVYHLRVDVSNLPAGVYVLKGSQDGQLFARRVVVK
jgi:alkaline phosphatase D